MDSVIFFNIGFWIFFLIGRSFGFFVLSTFIGDGLRRFGIV